MRDLDNRLSHLDDPSLRELSVALDALGREERAEPEAGFEARVAAATRPGVVATIRPSAWRSPALGIAAAAACLLVAVVGTWIARSGGGAAAPGVGGGVTLASIEQDIDDFLFVESLPGDLESLADEVDAAGGTTPADEVFFDLFDPEGGAS